MGLEAKPRDRRQHWLVVNRRCVRAVCGALEQRSACACKVVPVHPERTVGTAQEDRDWIWWFWMFYNNWATVDQGKLPVCAL
ncbi:hypothetical protein BDV12DRAFT_170782 [Aspergillus spectabilis]